MNSKWSHLKADAIALRLEGKTYDHIISKLGIPRSTLSGWMRHVTISDEARLRLQQARADCLSNARRAARIKHQDLKKERIGDIHQQIDAAYGSLLASGNLQIKEIALSMLYLGEGAKGDELRLGSSDVLILRFYLNYLKDLYGIDSSSLRFDLHLRADQDEVLLKKYWVQELLTDPSCFKGTFRDKRTEGKTSYSSYRGVCLVTGGGVEIQRRLLYLAKVFCEQSASAVSSVGRAFP
jgi:hypothetical protein